MKYIFFTIYSILVLSPALCAAASQKPETCWNAGSETWRDFEVSDSCRQCLIGEEKYQESRIKKEIRTRHKKQLSKLSPEEQKEKTEEYFQEFAKRTGFPSALIINSLCEEECRCREQHIHECAESNPWIDGFFPDAPEGVDDPDFTGIAWKVFIAANWPAANWPEYRGMPRRPNRPKIFCEGSLHQWSSRSRRAAENLRNWQTWKQNWELFEQSPTLWNGYSEPDAPPCKSIEPIDGKAIDITQDNWLSEFQKYGTLLTDSQQVEENPNFSISQWVYFLDQPFRTGIPLSLIVEELPEHLPMRVAGPVIDGSGNEIKYERRYNRELYESALGITKEISQLPEDASTYSTPTSYENILFPELPSDSIAIKAAWKKIVKCTDCKEKFDPKPGRYYQSTVLVRETGDTQKICRAEERVLVGMHIMFKNDHIHGQNKNAYRQNRWIYSTFEHIDNPKNCSNLESPGYQRIPQKMSRCIEHLSDLTEASPDNRPTGICRWEPLPADHSAAGQINERARQHLPAPWRNYRLIGVDWMLSGQSSTPLANTMIETYAQQGSCTGCHVAQAEVGDFVWSLALKRLSTEECSPKTP